MTETIQLDKKVETIVVQKAVKPKRSFSGFDIDISVELPELTLRIPAKYAKIDSKVVREKLQIVHRVGDVEVSNQPSPYSLDVTVFQSCLSNSFLRCTSRF